MQILCSALAFSLSSAGMFPDRYVDEFQKCLDEVRPFSFEEVRRIIEKELGPDKAKHLTILESASSQITYKVNTCTVQEIATQVNAAYRAFSAH